MADTIINVTISPNVWVDLYAATGVTVGAAISVMNVGVSDVYLSAQLTQPLVTHNSYRVVRRNGEPLFNEEGDVGAWAYCHAGSKVNIRVLT